MTKSELRKDFLAKRQAMSEDERANRSQAVCDQFFRSVDLHKVGTLHCYIPLERFNEINTYLILHRLWTEYPQMLTCVPRIGPVFDEIENLVLAPATTLGFNKWGIAEPEGDDIINVDEIDIVLVPLLCYDRQGHRVGYGKGYYDGLLARCRPDCRRVGLSYFPPVDGIPEIGAHDIPLDIIITPDEVYEPE